MKSARTLALLSALNLSHGVNALTRREFPSCRCSPFTPSIDHEFCRSWSPYHSKAQQHPFSMETPGLDIWTATVAEVQRSLSCGVTNSSSIVEAFLDQVEAHNTQGLKLRAIIYAALRDAVLNRASELDKEGLQGRVRSRLHGIPLIVKVLGHWTTDDTLVMC
jgi:hypothetical protein